jgi:hypothetical protein
MLSTQSGLIQAQAEPLYYDIVGLSLRDELVFKSYVRLLGPRLRHVWHYSPTSPQLVVAAQATQLPVPDDVPVITVGVSNQQREQFLALPFRHEEIAAELNRQGVILALQLAPSQAAQAFNDNGVLFGLSRWPRMDLMATLERKRMVAHLSAKTLSIAQLATLSGCAEPVCRMFIAELQNHGVIKLVRNSSPTPLPDTNQASVQAISTAPALSSAGESLFARIRKRLNFY